MKEVISELNNFCSALSAGPVTLEQAVELTGGKPAVVTELQVNVTSFSPYFKQAVLVKENNSADLNYIILTLSGELHLANLQKEYGQPSRLPSTKGKDDEYIFYPKQFEKNSCSIALISGVQGTQVITLTIRPNYPK